MKGKLFARAISYLIILGIFIFSVIESFKGLYEATAWQGFSGIILYVFGIIALVNIYQSSEDWFY